MKRFLSVVLVLVLLLCFSCVSNPNGNLLGMIAQADNTVESYIPEPVDLTTRDDCEFGINSHGAFKCPDYPEEYLEQQIHAVAKAGCTYLRINLYMPEDGDWTYNDTVIGLANKYGLKLIVTIQPICTMGLDYITLFCQTFATRYNGEDGRGFVDYFQVLNEIDNKLMRIKYGSSSARGDSETHFYNVSVDGLENDLPEYLEYFKAAEQGIHCEESNSKFTINFASTHYAFIGYMLRNGLKLDVVSWDKYADTNHREKNAKELEEILNEVETEICNKYDISVIIAETNTSGYILSQEERENPTLEAYQSALDNIYMFYKRPWIKAIIMYELLDETAKKATAEGWFGLIQSPNEDGIGITDTKYEKPIYKELQRLWGGNSDLRMIKRSEIDLTPYEKFEVGTADDSHIGNDEASNGSDAILGELPEIKWDDEEIEKPTEEVIVENVITPVKEIKSKETSYKMPWGVVIGVGVGLIVLAAGFVAGYILISSKKLKK